jgi:hypothetical protein
MNVLFQSTSFYFRNTLYMMSVTAHIVEWKCRWMWPCGCRLSRFISGKMTVNFIYNSSEWQLLIHLLLLFWCRMYTWQNWCTPTIFSLHLFSSYWFMSYVYALGIVGLHLFYYAYRFHGITQLQTTKRRKQWVPSPPSPVNKVLYDIEAQQFRLRKILRFYDLVEILLAQEPWIFIYSLADGNGESNVLLWYTTCVG